MAILEDGFYSGKMNGLIYKRVKNQQIVVGPSKKPHIKHTPAMVTSSGIFGKASTLNSYIRAYMGMLFDQFHDGEMVARLNKSSNLALNSAFSPETSSFTFNADSFNRLIGFEFNIESKVEDSLFGHVTVTYSENLVTVLIPEMTIPRQLEFPTGSKKCAIIISSTLVALNYGYIKESEAKVIIVMRDGESNVIPSQSIVFPTEPGRLCIIGIALHFYKDTFIGESLVNNKLFSPAAILSAHITDGIGALTEEGEEWGEMINEKGKIAIFPAPKV